MRVPTKNISFIHSILIGTAMVSIMFFANSISTNAFVITDIDGVITNDFALQPSKTELFLRPGETEVKNISITNRTDKTITFVVKVEDFIGSHNRDETVILLENKESPFSLKNYITPELETFTLEPLQKITMPITISIPQDIPPTGLYGTVIVSNQTSGENDADTESQTRLVSRLGSLFFVKIAGNVNEDGLLEDFRVSGSKQLIYNRGQLVFEILFSNKGNVHLIPYGVIEIRSMLGFVVETLPIDPYFALPDATRFRTMHWDGGIRFGRYSATLLLNRGYDDIIDESSVAVWIFPWKFTFGVLIVLIALFALSRFVEIRKRQ